MSVFVSKLYRFGVRCLDGIIRSLLILRIRILYGIGVLFSTGVYERGLIIVPFVLSRYVILGLVSLLLLAVMLLLGVSLWGLRVFWVVRILGLSYCGLKDRSK